MTSPHKSMQLDVVIPTYNRSVLLPKALRSLLDARVPPGLEVRITVVDNNSTDKTREIILAEQAKAKLPISYVFEKQQGRSPALNAGVAATTGSHVGFIDDDEQVDESWYEQIVSVFAEHDVDFIGGPYVPQFESAIPDWLPREYNSVIGAVDGGTARVPFDRNYPGILMGGNAVFTREILQKVGPYSTALGRSGNRLLSCEDEDMYARLLAAGARGMYVPELIIYHFVPTERLTKRYHRTWCFWQSVSSAVLDRIRPQPTAYVLGVPRYFYGRALRGMFRLVNIWNGEPASRFSNELSLWELAGFFYGKHFYRPDS
jgi:glycosyltransferase involved in cell wall biosynthesis